MAWQVFSDSGLQFFPQEPQFSLDLEPMDGEGLELRRMLSEARAVNESFTLEYEKLPGLSGDEAWRQTAVAYRVRLSEDGKGGRSCVSLDPTAAGAAGAEDGAWEPCVADELANQPAPQGLLMKLMLFLPIPVIPGLKELPCVQ